MVQVSNKTELLTSPFDDVLILTYRIPGSERHPIPSYNNARLPHNSEARSPRPPSTKAHGQPPSLPAALPHPR